MPIIRGRNHSLGIEEIKIHRVYLFKIGRLVLYMAASVLIDHRRWGIRKLSSRIPCSAHSITSVCVMLDTLPFKAPVWYWLDDFVMPVGSHECGKSSMPSLMNARAVTRAVPKAPKAITVWAYFSTRKRESPTSTVNSLSISSVVKSNIEWSYK